MTLADKVALVTGASQGIGRSVALALAGEGARLALVARTRADLEEVAGELPAQAGDWAVLPTDITDAGAVRDLPGAVSERLGPVEILVNSAGVAESHTFLDHPDELWHRTLEVNLTGAYYLCRAFAPGMVERGWGRIINIASIAGKVGGAYIAAYASSKHGLLGLTRSLAVEFAERGLTVNAICPGYVDTPMTDRSIANIVARTGRSEEEARQALETQNPQGRLMQPEEVAAVAVLLASEAASGINGQAINVDGGEVQS